MNGREWLLAALVVILLQAVPANQLSPVWIDEQVTYYIARGRTPDTVWSRAFEQSATPPGFFWLVAASSSVGDAVGIGSPEFWLRLPSLIAYLASMLIAWGMARREFGPSAASATAVIFAIHRAGAGMAMESRPYAVGLLLGLIALECLLRLRHSKQWRWSAGIFFWSALAALPWMHYLFAVLYLPAFLQVVFSKEYVGFRRRLVAGMVVAGLFSLPLIPGFLRIREISAFLETISETSITSSFRNLLHVKGLAAAIATAFVLGRFPLRTSSSRFQGPPHSGWAWILIWWLLPMSTLIVVSIVRRQPTLATLHYSLPVFGPFAVVIAGMFASLSRGRFAAFAALVYMFVSIHGVETWKRIRQPQWMNSEWKWAGELLREQAGTADIAFVQSGLVEVNLTPIKYADVAFQEYATSMLSELYAGGGFRRLALPYEFPKPGGEFLVDYSRRVEDARKAKAKVWLVIHPDFEERCQRGFERWIRDQGFRTEIVRQNEFVHVLRCEALSTPD